jgi:hypothetical protein
LVYGIEFTSPRVAVHRNTARHSAPQLHATNDFLYPFSVASRRIATLHDAFLRGALPRFATQRFTSPHHASQHNAVFLCPFSVASPRIAVHHTSTQRLATQRFVRFLYPFSVAPLLIALHCCAPPRNALHHGATPRNAASLRVCQAMPDCNAANVSCIHFPFAPPCVASSPRRYAAPSNATIVYE